MTVFTQNHCRQVLCTSRSKTQWVQFLEVMQCNYSTQQLPSPYIQHFFLQAQPHALLKSGWLVITQKCIQCEQAVRTSKELILCRIKSLELNALSKVAAFLVQALGTFSSVSSYMPLPYLNHPLLYKLINTVRKFFATPEGQTRGDSSFWRSRAEPRKSTPSPCILPLSFIPSHIICLKLAAVYHTKHTQVGKLCAPALGS